MSARNTAHGRTKEEDQRLFDVAGPLNDVMRNIEHCEDIDCLELEINKLYTLVEANRDIWNFKGGDYGNVFVTGARHVIQEIPRIIETNRHFVLDFNAHKSAQSVRIIGRIKEIFEMLDIVFEIQVIMNTSRDNEIAAQLSERINSLEFRQQEEEEGRIRLESELLERRRLELIEEERERKVSKMLEDYLASCTAAKIREQEEQARIEARIAESKARRNELKNEKEELEEELEEIGYVDVDEEEEYSEHGFTDEEEHGFTDEE